MSNQGEIYFDKVKSYFPDGYEFNLNYDMDFKSHRMKIQRNSKEVNYLVKDITDMHQAEINGKQALAAFEEA